MTLIRRPLIAPAYSGAAPAPAPRADGILFLRASRPGTETETPDNDATEAAPAATCSACESFGEALARIEVKLTSLLHEVERLRYRMDKAFGPETPA